MFEVAQGYNLILASASPRRKQLLESIGINFKVVISNYPENSLEQDPAERASEFALQKALAVYQMNPKSLVIGSDTVVASSGQIFEKPTSREDAFFMLEKLAGRTHSVFGGIAIIYSDLKVNALDSKTIIKCLVETKVTFRPLNKQIIKTYLNVADYTDKAGAYGIQDTAQIFVSDIQGSYTNVMGLDIVRLSEELLKIGAIKWKQ